MCPRLNGNEDAWQRLIDVVKRIGSEGMNIWGPR